MNNNQPIQSKQSSLNKQNNSNKQTSNKQNNSNKQQNNKNSSIQIINNQIPNNNQIQLNNIQKNKKVIPDISDGHLANKCINEYSRNCMDYFEQLRLEGKLKNQELERKIQLAKLLEKKQEEERKREEERISRENFERTKRERKLQEVKRKTFKYTKKAYKFARSHWIFILIAVTVLIIVGLRMWYVKVFLVKQEKKMLNKYEEPISLAADSINDYFARRYYTTNSPVYPMHPDYDPTKEIKQENNQNDNYNEEQDVNTEENEEENENNYEEENDYDDNQNELINQNISNQIQNNKYINNQTSNNNQTLNIKQKKKNNGVTVVNRNYDIDALKSNSKWY